ncbi:MAG: ACT domain-containing protein, partial [Desulfuromonadaceae bacterium]|nr:ACT domain-containing protein [Desulfuromonadaceae bacterium]
MKAYQLTIPAKNQPGVLARVTSILAREKINIRATTISSFGDYGFFNLIVDDVEGGEKILKKEGIEVELKEVIAVLMKDQPGGLDKLMKILAAAGVNIENAYGFVIESHVD